jgi:iron complex outermembrane receptor protein
VALKGTAKGATTNGKGEFEIRNVESGTHTIIASFVGLQTSEQTVEVKAGEASVISFTLNETSQQLSEVVVRGERANKFTEPKSDYVSKMPLKNLENPQVYTSISKELLVGQMVFAVDDAVKNAAGMSKMWDATGRGGDGGAFYNLRGFILQSQLRNGVAGNVTSRIDAANLQTLEVIKGPSATLFGSTMTSYGGLVNRVTKKPYRDFGGEVSYSAGSYSFNRISADVNTPIDEEKNVLLRVNTAYFSEGTFQDNGFKKGYAISPSLSYRVNDRLSFLIEAELYGGKNSSEQFVFFYYPTSQLQATNPEELGLDYMRSYSSNDIYQESRSTNFFGKMEYKISDKWTSQTNISRTHSFSDGPYAYYYVIPDAEVTGDPNDTGANYLVRADQSTGNSEMQVTEIQQNFIGEFMIGNLKNRLVVGLDYFNQNSNQFFYGANFDIIPKNGTIPTYRDFNRHKLDSVLMTSAVWTWPYEYKTNTYSAYASDVLNLTDKLIVQAALRVDHFDNKGSFDEASGEYSGGFTQTVLSPKFGVVYQVVKDKISLFGNYMNGFTNKTGKDYKGDIFKPEQANQLEGGVKFDLLDGRISSTVSYYDIQVKDIVRSYIGESPDPSNPNPQIQDGTQESKGIEVEVAGNPVRGFDIMAAFSYNDSRYKKSEEGVEGRRPSTAMSPYNASVWLSYKVQRGALQGFGAGFGGNYSSDNKIMNSVAEGVFTLPAYTVLNATVFYDHANFRVGLKMDNITDEHYWIGYTTMTPQKLRSVTGSLTFRF